MNASLLDSLGQFAQWLAGWVPRLSIMPATHRGVRFRRGNKLSVIKPGLYVWLPIITEVESLPVARQTLNLPIQTLKTKDRKTVAINVIVVYEISDIMRALVETWDVEQTITDIALAADVGIVTSHELDWLLDHVTDEVQTLLTKATRSALHPFGVKVLKAFVSDLCDCTVYRLLGDAPMTKAGLDLESE